MRKILCLILAAVLVLGLLLMAVPSANAAATMKSSQKLVDVIKQMEGFSAKPYEDNGQWSVGYGTACPADKLAEYQANGITVAAAEALMKKHLTEFETAVNNFATQYSLKLSQHKFDALVSFSYNCGTAWMRETTGYFNKAVRWGYTGSKFIYAMGLFSGASGNYILMGRRMCEANMYLNGVYKASNSGDNAYPSTYKWLFLDANGGRVQYSIYAYDAAEKLPVDIHFTDIPTGADSEGKVFAYDFAGWYTEAGKQVKVLDTSLANGTVLYAKWKDPSGKIVSLPKGEKVNNIKVTVTADSVNVRSGPATFYSQKTAVTKNTQLTITEIYEAGSYTWGKFDKGWLRLDFTNYASVKPGSTFPKKGTVNASDVNYRTKPETGSATLVGQKQKGDRVTITEERYSNSLWWGKMSDGYWICLDYVTYDSEKAPGIVAIGMWRLPDKTEYFQNKDNLQYDGAVVMVYYDDGSTSAMSLISDMVSGFSNAKVGTVNVKVTYSGKSTTFPVKIISQSGTVTFKNYDGKVLSSKAYHYGDTVTPPEVPARAADANYVYVFAGWDKPVTVCNGDAVYTAVFHSISKAGDLNSDGAVDNEDVILLLWHTVFPEDYPLEKSGELTGDGVINNLDVIQLLWHTVFPEDYPIQ